MNDMVSKSDVLDIYAELYDVFDDNKAIQKELNEVYDKINNLKEQEAKHGQWVRLTGMAPPEYHGHKICSMCGSFAPYDPIHTGREILPKYCPGCGAEMEGAAE